MSSRKPHFFRVFWLESFSLSIRSAGKGIRSLRTTDKVGSSFSDLNEVGLNGVDFWVVGREDSTPPTFGSQHTT